MVNHVLIITSNNSDAMLLKDVFGQAKGGSFDIEWVTRLSDGLERLHTDDVDAILVDLSLPDSQGIATFDKLFAIAPQTAILVLGVEDSALLATEALERGAQGYLPREYFNNKLVLQSLNNTIERKKIEAALFIERNRAEITLNSISDAVICTDISNNITYMNIAAEGMTGWQREEVLGHPISTVMRIANSKTREPVINPIEWVLQRDEVMALTAGTILIRRDGGEAAIEDSAAPIHGANGKIVGAVIVFHDITVAQAIVAKMAHLAQHDSLTNLPNRVLLGDRITQAIALAKRRGTQLALLFLDLDNFKHINDSIGHAVGDKLLQSVAQRLCTCVRSSDTVSRLGGDEFVILVAQDKHAQDAALIAEKILAALAISHSIDEYDLHVTTSIGISTYPADGQDAETLIKNADIAMYHAKKKGRNNFRFFKDEMNIRIVERHAIETHLRDALQRQEFELYYQPTVNLESGMINGAEALLRWRHPAWGMLLPDRFVQIAEDCGLIVPIGRWVLREACVQAKRWEEAGQKLGSLAINISAAELRCKDFVDSVQAILDETGLEPSSLQLDIAESILMCDFESCITILRQLKNVGVLLAIDNFGAGSSNLNYLPQLPIDILKFAPSFVQNIGRSNEDGIIISTVIAMGVRLKKRVIAGGVEKQEQLVFLKRQHCEEGQGYFLCRPIAPEQLARLLVTRPCSKLKYQGINSASSGYRLIQY